MGRSFIKGILNSSRGLHPGDQSPKAQQMRRISGFADLEGVEFVAKIDVDKDQNGELKNIIKSAVTPDQKGYAEAMSAAPATPVPAAYTAPAPQTAPTQEQPAVPSSRPAWAQ